MIGVGVLSEFGKKGYTGLTAEEIYSGVVYDDGNFASELVVTESLPILLKHHANSIPINKYISQLECELSQKHDIYWICTGMRRYIAICADMIEHMLTIYGELWNL